MAGLLSPSTPLPKLQLFLVLLVQITEPITANVIYPFITQLIVDTGVTHGDQRKTGYYAGVIQSLFFIMEGLTVVQWGRASDRFGRKPILLVGMFGLALATAGFGLSSRFWGLALSRAAQGVCNGNIGVTKTVLAEIADTSNMARIFAFIPLTWAMGVAVGPILGGVLVYPADRWPRTLGQSAFLRAYPYFLPCVAAALVPVAAFVLVWAGLKETLPGAVAQKRKGDPSASEDASLISHGADLDYGTATPPVAQGPPPLRTVLIPRVLLPMAHYAMLCFVDQCFQILMPLMYSSPIELGGLGLSPYEIGLIMGVWGFANGLLQVITFARLADKLGLRNLYIVGFTAFFVAIGAFPVMAYLAQRAGRVDAAVWAVLVVQLTSYVLIYMSYGCMALLFVAAAPSHSALSTVNGVGQVVSSAMRAAAPATASSLFAASLERGSGNDVYWVLLGLVGVCLYATRWVTPADAAKDDEGV